MSQQGSASLKLPPISRGKPQNQQSPFHLGNDNEIFIESQGSINEPNKKIWEKTTANHRNPLKRFDKFNIPIDQKYIPATVYGLKEKKVIQEALELINNRKKNKDFNNKKEIIVDVLEQKKEMFLVTMTHEIIQNEIMSLKNQSNERKKALEESEELLQNDKKEFQKHQEIYKEKNKRLEIDYENQIKERKVLEQQIKSQQIIVNSLRTEKTRNEENINSYLKYKKFLDQLLPKGWIEEKETEKEAKIEQIKFDYFSRWGLETESLNLNESSTQLDSKSKYQKRFEEGIEKEEIPQVLRLQNQEQMYFSEPYQIIELLNGLEQTNLFCIQNSRMASQSYQVFKTQFQQKRIYLEEKYKSLIEHKMVLEKQLYDTETQIRMKKKELNNTSISEKDHKDLKVIIEGEYNNMKDIMPVYMPEFENSDAAPLSLLSCIEICMEKLLDRLFQASSADPKLIGSIRVMLEKRKNTEKREEAAMNKEQEERRKNRNQNKKEATVRMIGRVDMMRSAPRDKQKVKKVEVEDNALDNDKKYFME